MGSATDETRLQVDRYPLKLFKPNNFKSHNILQSSTTKIPNRFSCSSKEIQWDR